MPRKSARPRQFAWAFAVLWLAAVTFAIYGGVGWLLTLWHVSPLLAVLMAVTFAMAPLVAAAMTGPAIRGGVMAWVCVLIFTAMDAAGNANAFWEFEKLATQHENDARARAYKAELSAAQVQLAAAQGKLDALPSASSVCIGHGPNNCKARLEGLSADAERLTVERDRASAAVKAVVAPEKVTLLPREVSGAIFGLAAFAMLAGFLGTHHAAAKAERSDTAPAKRKQRRKPKPAPKPPAAPKARKVEPVEDLPLFSVVKGGKR